MNWLKTRIFNLKQRVWGNRLTRPEIFFFIVTGIFFLINSIYVSYPDEFVNLMAGKSIVSGGLPYRDFWDHHLPLAWYLSAALLKLSLNSFVVLRVLWAALTFGLLYWLAIWIRKNYRDFYYYYLAFFLAYPLMAVYFWFHLYLADSLAVLFFSISFWILIVQTLSKRLDFRATVLASLSTFAMIFSSLTFLYLGAALYLWQVYLVGIKNRQFWYLVLWTISPYLVYLLFLFLTGTFADFYFANVTYNTNLYISIPNYTRGRFFNPVKFGATLVHNFFDGYLPLLSKIKHLDLYLPIGTLSGLGTLLLLLLLFTKNWIVAGLFFLILSFSAPRSNIQNYKETDYQSAMFLVLGVASSLIALYLMKRYKSKEEVLNDVRRVGQFLLAVFFGFTLLFLVGNSYSKFFQVYTQKLPRITNYSFSAQFIDSILNEGDYYWIGPFEPHNEFFVKKGRLPGKYPTLLPQFRENNYLKQTFIEQFENNPPKIIIFKHEASIFGTPAIKFGAFFLDWMEDKYTSVENLEDVKVKGSPSDFNISSDLYIRNDQIDNILERIRSTGYVE